MFTNVTVIITRGGTSLNCVLIAFDLEVSTRNLSLILESVQLQINITILGMYNAS